MSEFVVAVGGSEAGEARSALLYHGGNLAAARRLYPSAPEPWLDLSTGINPRPYPLPSLDPEVWSRLPEPQAHAELEAAAAGAYGARDPAGVVAAPGTQALIQLLPALHPARRVAVLGATYAEHARAWAASGARVDLRERLHDLVDADVGVVVNPNNPDGRHVPAGLLSELAETLAARGGLLVVDEAFMDVLPPGASLVPRLPPRGVAVLRSFGKTYGLAGLRLGFLVTSADLAANARARLGPWAVSGPAIAIGRAALRDETWRREAVTRLERDAARLDDLLAGAGFEVAGGTPLFRLALAADAHGRHDRLARRGILVRAFASHPDRLRFGLPGDEAGFGRLADALRDGS